MSAQGELDRIVATAQSSGSKRILLAEDSPSDVYLIRQAILKHQKTINLEMIVVTDGEQAIDYILRQGRFIHACRPDLIVLDLNLPKSNGVDVLRCVREQSDLTEVAVVVLTSSDSPADRSLAEQFGATGFITKPMDLDAFMAVGGTLLQYVDDDVDEAGSASRLTA